MTATSAGRVYDRGYRPYAGELGGRRAAVRALWLASIRRALGIRRSLRQKLFPWLLLAIVTVPAVVNVGIAYVTRDTPAEDFTIIGYRDDVGVSTALLVFVGLTAPDVICPDRRHRMLPLLFALPLTGFDYVIATVGAIFTIVFAFGYLPRVLLFVGQMLVSDAALDYLGDNAAQRIARLRAAACTAALRAAMRPRIAAPVRDGGAAIGTLRPWVGAARRSHPREDACPKMLTNAAVWPIFSWRPPRALQAAGFR